MLIRKFEFSTIHVNTPLQSKPKKQILSFDNGPFMKKQQAAKFTLFAPTATYSSQMSFLLTRAKKILQEGSMIKEKIKTVLELLFLSKTYLILASNYSQASRMDLIFWDAFKATKCKT